MMKHALLITLILASPVAAKSRPDQMLDRMAQFDDAPAWSAGQIRRPPKRYHGNGAFLYREASPLIVAEMCRNYEAVGCTIGGFVIGPNACSHEFYGERLAALLCHEKAHVMGWGGDHPD